MDAVFTNETEAVAAKVVNMHRVGNTDGGLYKKVVNLCSDLFYSVHLHFSGH